MWRRLASLGVQRGQAQLPSFAESNSLDSKSQFIFGVKLAVCIYAQEDASDVHRCGMTFLYEEAVQRVGGDSYFDSAATVLT